MVTISKGKIRPKEKIILSLKKVDSREIWIWNLSGFDNGKVKPIQCTGQSKEAVIGLYDYHARFYDPSIGRYVQADTIVPGPGSPQSWDRFAYVNNNPINYYDPSGHVVCQGELSCESSSIYNDSIKDDITGGKVGSDSNFPNFPDPTIPPVSIGTFPGCTLTTYTECFYARQRLTIVGDNQGDWDQLAQLMMAVYFDVKKRNRTSLDHMAYDTPFWDGGQQEGRVCFGENCYGGAEVNYFAQGMWSAAQEESIEFGEVMIVDNWKHANWLIDNVRSINDRSNYTFWPSEGTIYWFRVGYTSYTIFDNNYETLYNLYTP